MQIPAITSTTPIQERRKLISSNSSPFAEEFDFSKYLSGDVNSSTSTKFRQDAIERMTATIAAEYLGLDDDSSSPSYTNSSIATSDRALNDGDDISINAMIEDSVEANVANYEVQEVAYDEKGISKISIGGVTFTRSTDENDPMNLFIGPNGSRYFYNKNSLIQVSNPDEILQGNDATGARVIFNNDVFVITDGSIGSDINMKNATTGATLETATCIGLLAGEEATKSFKEIQAKYKEAMFFSNEDNYNEEVTKLSNELAEGKLDESSYALQLSELDEKRDLAMQEKMNKEQGLQNIIDEYNSLKYVLVYEIGSEKYNYDNGTFTKRSSNLEEGGNIEIKSRKTVNNQLIETYSDLGATVLSIDSEALVVKNSEEKEQTYYKLSSADANGEGLRSDMNFYKYNDGSKVHYYVLEGTSLVEISNINDPKYQFIYEEVDNFNGVDLAENKGAIYQKGDAIYNELGQDVTNDPSYYNEFEMVWFGEEYDTDKDLEYEADSPDYIKASALKDNQKFEIDLSQKATKGYLGLSIKNEKTVYAGTNGRLFTFEAGRLTEVRKESVDLYNLDSYKETLNAAGKTMSCYEINEAYYTEENGLLVCKGSWQNVLGIEELIKTVNVGYSHGWCAWIAQVKVFKMDDTYYIVPKTASDDSNEPTDYDQKMEFNRDNVHNNRTSYWRKGANFHEWQNRCEIVS